MTPAAVHIPAVDIVTTLGSATGIAPGMTPADRGGGATHQTAAAALPCHMQLHTPATGTVLVTTGVVGKHASAGSSIGKLSTGVAITEVAFTEAAAAVGAVAGRHAAPSWAEACLASSSFRLFWAARERLLDSASSIAARLSCWYCGLSIASSVNMLCRSRSCLACCSSIS